MSDSLISLLVLRIMAGGYELLKHPVVQTAGTARRSRCRVLYTLILLGATASISFLYAFSPKIHDILNNLPLHTESAAPDHLAQCPASIAPPANAPAPVNLWAPLTVQETTSIHDWLLESSRGLNFTLANQATLSDNAIFLIEIYRPSKADALAYLEAPTASKLPARYARVSVHLAARPDSEGGPVIKDYLVGPLPIGTRTSLQELKGVYHREDIPYNARGFSIATELTSLLVTYMPRLAEVTKVCLNPDPQGSSSLVQNAKHHRTSSTALR